MFLEGGNVKLPFLPLPRRQFVVIKILFVRKSTKEIGPKSIKKGRRYKIFRNSWWLDDGKQDNADHRVCFDVIKETNIHTFDKWVKQVVCDGKIDARRLE